MPTSRITRRRVLLSTLLAPAVVLMTPAATVSVAAGEEEPHPPGEGADALVRSLLLATLPREYEHSKNWGQTDRRWDGLHVSFDGLRVKTKRRWKEVNHGTWTRYQAKLVDPEHQLQVRSNGLRSTDNQRAAFDLTVHARLQLTGRLSEWLQGVQLYSISAEADAAVRLAMTCEAGLKFDRTSFPPGVLLDPRVTAAQLDLVSFDLHRISQADGPLVRKLGDELHDVLQDEINDRRETLVAKINRAIEKRSDRLRLSLPDLTRLTGAMAE